MSRDPITNESYLALRNALLAMMGDESAMLSVLSSQSDGGKSWVEIAYHELRRELVQGRVQQAETLGQLIGTVLDIQEQGAADELAENQLHRDAMKWLVDGIGAILAQDNLTGIKHLEGLTEAVYCNESLRWVAWLWIARAAADEGDLDQGRTAARAALELAEGIDAQAKGLALCTKSEIEFLGEEVATALAHLSSAIATFEATGDRRGMAMASLALARMQVRLGREDDGLAAGRRAMEADADWDEPAVFLSQRAMRRGRLSEAEQLLQPFRESGQRSPEVIRQIRLLRSVAEGKILLPIIGEYLEIKDRLIRDSDLPLLERLWSENPGFVEIRELLAWSLLKLGQEERACTHFEELSGQTLDPDIHASVLLGLGCLANRRFQHRQSAARVRATVGASPPPPPVGLAPSVEVEVLLAEPAQAEPIGQSIEAITEEVSWSSQIAPAVKAVVGGGSTALPESGARAVFTGDLQLFAVPDLLEFLKSSRRTGTLVITSEKGIGAVHLRQGMITGAASPHCINIGDCLLRSGAISQEQLASAAESQQKDSPDALLGSILVQRGVLSQEALRGALASQIKDAVFEMVGWSNGRFAFEPDKRSQVEREAVMDIELDTQAVLLDVLRLHDEQNRDQT